MNRCVTNIGVEKSIELGMIFNVHQMNRLCKKDGKRGKESVEDMVMRLQKTFLLVLNYP